MEWLAQNWFWVLIFIFFIAMHLFGHGHGGHGAHGSQGRSHDHGDQGKHGSQDLSHDHSGQGKHGCCDDHAEEKKSDPSGHEHGHHG